MMFSMPNLWTLIIPVVLFSALVGMAGGWALSRYVLYNDLIDGVSIEESYYRGVYDICHSAAALPSSECLVMVQKAIGSDWFSLESSGWEWNK